MAFNDAHDFNINTANIASTNNGPVMFWNNTYHTGATHNQAVVSSDSPTTVYMGGRPRARPPPLAVRSRRRRRQHRGSENSFSASSDDSSSDSSDEQRPRLVAPPSHARSRSRRSDTSPPEQSSPSPAPAAPLDRQQSEYSSYSSPQPQPPPPSSPLPPSTPSYQPQYEPSLPASSQVDRQAEAWSSSPEPPPPNVHAQAQSSPQISYSETPPLLEDHGTPQIQSVPSGSPFVAGGDSFYAETEIPLPPTEAHPPPPPPGGVARSSSGSSPGLDAQGKQLHAWIYPTENELCLLSVPDHINAQKKRTFWQRMKSWGSKKREASTKRR